MEFPLSWILKDATCKDCGQPIEVGQSRMFDYLYQCTNTNCENHQGEELFDDEECSFAKASPK